MGYRIGMDFGTTNSTVAYLNVGSQQPEAFKFPSVESYEYIPSCVAYHDDKISVGRAAFDFVDVSEAVFCNNFKMILPMPPEKRDQFHWTKTRTPEIVITDYFRNILSLSGDDSASFASQKGSIDGIVLSVPHVWAKDPSHKGRSELQSIIQELGCPLIQLISEPVAAAAYFAHRFQQQKQGDFSGNLLVCDMGGGTFDVTLCRVQPGKIEEIFNEGNGRLNMGKAGVQFDNNLLKSKGLIPDTIDFYEAYKKLQECKSNQHKEITQQINNAIDDPDIFADKKILRAGGRYEFTYKDIKNAFEEIRLGIENVLQHVKQEIDRKNLQVDNIFFVGGFSQFILVRDCIKKFLGIGQNDVRLITDINNEIARYAIAFGAALVANDKIAVEEKYEHTLGIRGIKVVKRGKDNYEQDQILIPIIKGGGKLWEYDKPIFSDMEVKAYTKAPDIHIYVDLSSHDKPYVQKLPDSFELPHAELPNNSWRVGMRINKSKVVYLIFEDTTYKTQKEYELGDIIRQMFGTLVVEE